MPTTIDPSDTTDDPTEGPTTGPSDSSGGCEPGTFGCPCDGGDCNADLECVENVCESPITCGVDLFEPNNGENNPAELGTITDDDDDGMVITAVLEGGDDVDWFTYFGDDTLLSAVSPARDLTTVGALRLCKFAECEEGLFSTEVTCPEGTAQAMSPDGVPGCCGDDSFEIDLNCLDTMNENATIYMRLDQGQSDCTQYTLDFHY